MTRRKNVRAFFAMATLMIGSTLAFAHNGVEHVMGTVTALSDASITVDTTKHKTITVKVDSATTFTNKASRATVKELKVGDRVVIDAKEIADEKLQAVSVKWGASSAKKMPAGMKMPADHKM